MLSRLTMPTKAKNMTLEQVLSCRTPWRIVLTKWELNNLEKYLEIYGNGYAFNLGQSANKFPVVPRVHKMASLHCSLCCIMQGSSGAGHWVDFFVHPNWRFARASMPTTRKISAPLLLSKDATAIVTLAGSVRGARLRVRSATQCAPQQWVPCGIPALS